MMNGSWKLSQAFRRLSQKVPDRLVSPVLCATAQVWRRTAMHRVTVIGITGSAGKTTTKFLLSAALARHGGATASPGNLNTMHGVAWSQFHARPWKRFHVQEIAIGRACGPIENLLALARPQVAVVTTIGQDHLSHYGSIEAIAREKGKLVEWVPAAGLVVLNADDPRVVAMAARSHARVVTYGTSPGATFRATSMQSVWPDRLAIEIEHDNGRWRVATRLLGTHLAHSVLAAFAAAVTLGVPPSVAAAAIGSVEPVEGRMEPVVTADGVTFIRDDVKATLTGMRAPLDFLRQARASRKIAVIGTISDYIAKPAAVYAGVARQALEFADLVVCVGPRAGKSVGAKSHPRGDRLHAFVTRDHAAAFLAGALQPGDLVLLKGSVYADRLGELCRVRLGGTDSVAALPPRQRPAVSTPIIVGLGNPRPGLADTPHNAGAQAVRAFADSQGAAWQRRGDCRIASVSVNGRSTYLVELDTPVNRSGPVARRLCDELGGDASTAIIVLDDVSLEPGKARYRDRGGDGGHLGLRSIIQAFGTDAIARVRIGVGAPADRSRLALYVISPLPPAAQAAVTAARPRVFALLADAVASRRDHPAAA